MSAHKAWALGELPGLEPVWGLRYPMGWSLSFLSSVHLLRGRVNHSTWF